MNKTEIREFFDKCAEWWDEDMVRNEAVIKRILDNAGVKSDVSVLDVACGTGVLFPDYLKRQVKAVTAIDISPKMVEIAKRKFPDFNIICGDVESAEFNEKFDCVMVYNAFPHFPNPYNLIKVLSNLTAKGGKCSIAHGMSREALLTHHKRAKNVSLPLPEIDELANTFSNFFEVELAISNEETYQIVGIRK